MREVANLVRESAVFAPQSTWQAQDVSNRPDMKLWEVENVVLHVTHMPPIRPILAREVEPNLPWAEDHFQERMSGNPLNPGNEYLNWPHWRGQDEMKDGDKFSHTYMERYWPRLAGIDAGDREDLQYKAFGHSGIRYRYGDLYDVLALLDRDPYTRQAYVPIFFPEDTGAHHQQRVPCTLGYHFMRRPQLGAHDRFNIYYPIRSCDYFRHFRDDVYMTVRLAQWMLETLKGQGSNWDDVDLGSFTMHIYSLHYFEGDRYIHKEFFDG